MAFDIVRDKEVNTTFPPDESGDIRTIFTGSLVERVTNLDTLASVTLNISGPGTITEHPDGSMLFDLKGANLLTFFPTDTPAGPLTIFNRGRWVIDVSPTFDFVELSRSGQSEDICAALS